MNYTKSLKSNKKLTEIIYSTKQVIQKKDRIFDFSNFKSIQSFTRDTMNGTNTLNNAQEEKMQLKYTLDNFNSSTRPIKQNKKGEKDHTLMSVNELLLGRQMLINAF